MFILANSEQTGKLEQLLCDIPMEYVELAHDISEMASLQFARKFSDSMIITLSDHLYAVITRFQEGVNIANGLIWDIQRFYELEFEIGLRALDLVEEKLHIRLPEDEAAYIALHIVNAEMDGTSMQQTQQITKVIQEITNIVKYYFSIEFDTASAYYYRFITHLKFFALRLFKDTQYAAEESAPEDEGPDLFDVVKIKYETAYKCALKIKNFLEKKYHYSLQDEEILYLVIHIQRAVYKSSK